MLVAAVPAYRNRAINPYNALLYGAVQRAGITVKEFGAGTLMGPRPEVVQIHWPEWLFSAPTLARARMQARAFRLTVTMLRARGSRIVWTVHNLDSHFGHQPELERRMWAWFTANIDGWIALSHSTIGPVIERYPRLANVPHTVVAHGHYRDVYPNHVTRAEARVGLGIPLDARVFGFVGNILPYKQVPLLANCFSQLEGGDLRLVIAGNPKEQQDAAIRAVRDERIVYRPGFVADTELQLYHRAADRIVLPYNAILNSGSVILALSFDVPVLVPNLGAMSELADVTGAEWVLTYDGMLAPEILAEAIATTPSHAQPDLSELEWHVLGKQTATFFDEVLASSPNSGQHPRRAKRRKNRPAKQRRRG